jgi:hypothetical protein
MLASARTGNLAERNYTSLDAGVVESLLLRDGA